MSDRLDATALWQGVFKQEYDRAEQLAKQLALVRRWWQVGDLNNDEIAEVTAILGAELTSEET